MKVFGIVVAGLGIISIPAVFTALILTKKVNHYISIDLCRE